MDESTEIENPDNELAKLIQKCSLFVTDNDALLGKKFYDMNLLYTMWSNNTNEDFPTEVYACVVEMFAANALRPLRPSSYAPWPPADDFSPSDDRRRYPPQLQSWNSVTVETDQLYWAQVSMAYRTFHAFLEREHFAWSKLEPYLDRRLVGALVHRWNAPDAGERAAATETLARIADGCPAVRDIAFRGALHELTDFAYGYAPPHRHGVDDMLGFLADAVDNTDPSPENVAELEKVLIRLVKHRALATFKCKLLECAHTIDEDCDDLIPRILVCIVDFWPSESHRAITSLRIIVQLYEWCDKSKWNEIQKEVVGRLTKLFGDEDFQLADEAMSLWHRMLNDMLGVHHWVNKEEAIQSATEALIKVKQTHWNLDCRKVAKNLLSIMVFKKLIKENYEEDTEETFQEGRPNGKNYDYVSKCGMMPLTNSMRINKENLTLNKSVADLR